MMRELVELGLGRPGGPAGSDLSGFVDRLLELLADQAPDSALDATANFLTDIAIYRRRLQEAAVPRDVAIVTAACLETCDKYLRGSRQYLTDREAELTELIRILRDAATLISGHDSEFSTQLLGSTRRFEELSQLNDIRELRWELAREVSALRAAVTDKQRRDEETFSSLNLRVEVLQMKLSKAEEEAALDSLTRVANRRSFDRTLRRMTAHARQSKIPLTLAMLDVDSFKKINDTHGHPIGDRVLLCAASWLARSLRQTDFIARYGGEEFAVILNDAAVDDVEHRLSRILADIAAAGFEYDDGAETRSVRFTLCCGATDLTMTETDEELLKRADAALYEAKRKGPSSLVTKKRSRLAGVFGRI